MNPILDTIIVIIVFAAIGLAGYFAGISRGRTRQKHIAWVRSAGSNENDTYLFICRPNGEMIDTLGVRSLDHWQYLMDEWLPGLIEVRIWREMRNNKKGGIL